MAANERRKASPPGGRGVPKESAKNEANVGNALRSVYENTVSEAIPSDLLDLLGKLS